MLFQCISFEFVQYLICREEENSDEDGPPGQPEDDTFKAAILYQVCKIDINCVRKIYGLLLHVLSSSLKNNKETMKFHEIL